MRITVRALRRLIREQFTQSVTGYPFADERDVTSQNNDVITLRNTMDAENRGHYIHPPVIGDYEDIFADDDGLKRDEDGDFPDMTPMVDPYVRDAHRT